MKSKKEPQTYAEATKHYVKVPKPNEPEPTTKSATARPWEVKEAGGDTLIQNNEGQCVAFVHMAKDFPYLEDDEVAEADAEGHANAALIVAAVNTLDALERIRRAAQALFDAPHQEHFVVRLNDEENAALEELRAALALASAADKETP